MTVRWKPLLILSGVFACIAVVGLVAITFAMRPGGALEKLKEARAERAGTQYAKAQIRYQQALQLDGKNPAVHEEMAAMYEDWGKAAAAEKQTEIRNWRLASLAEAAKYGRTLKAPRRALLASAMERDDVPEGLRWAKEVRSLEPNNPDALYLLTSEALDETNPNAADIKRSLALLEEAKAPDVRLSWIKAKLASSVEDTTGLEQVMIKARGLRLPDTAGPVDRMALVRLRALDVETTADPARLPERVRALQDEAHTLSADPSIAPNRILRLSLLLEHAQKTLTSAAAQAESNTKTVLTELVESIEKDVESIFQKALPTASKSDLHVYLVYADHLRFRGQGARCLETIDQGLKSPLAKQAASQDVVMGLHAIAVETALGDTKDPQRFDKAAPHVKDLIASPVARFQGLGHLFQGAIELEHSGVASAPDANAPKGEPAVASRAQPKLRASALNHLKIAAEQLPQVVEAQARYGVALILAQEPNLGRQYLQNAMRLGNAEPQFQIWAAWSMVQAGYAEEAEPIVNNLMSLVAQGRAPRDFEATLHLLNGEIHQARQATPDDLEKALAEYERSYDGKQPPPSVLLHMAQIDVQLGKPDRALKRIAALRARGEGGTTAEHLAVLVLMDQDKSEEAFQTLRAARAKFPTSDDLVGLEAALLSKAKKPKEADKVLADFLTKDPDNLTVILMRAQVLADDLQNVKEARRVLVNAADRSQNSAPLVQLALLDLKQKDFDAVSATIAKIRARWKEAAAADLLDAQLALEQGNPGASLDHFDAALRKDPANKLVQFWKAQVESRLGASTEAAKAFEALARDGSSKRLDTNVSLTDAAQSALAGLALQEGKVDEAIRKFESLRATHNNNGLVRSDRWQLIAAYAMKNQWPAARKEIAALVNDPKTPPTNEERVQAANFYRLNKEDKPAIEQLDYVLSVDPAHPGAVVTRAYMLYAAKKPTESADLIRKAIAVKGKETPPAMFFLLLSAMENMLPPQATAATRAMTALDQGLEARAHALELVEAKYRLLKTSKGAKDALAFVEAQAKAEPTGQIPRMLVEVYREQGNYEAAESQLASLVEKSPKDANLAAGLVRMTAIQAALAGDKNDKPRSHALNEKLASLIRVFREKFPNELAFLQEECELAFRRGDFAHANAVTKEVDQIAKNSPAGPLLRGRLFTLQNRPREAAEAYAEALTRNPNQPNVRLILAQTYLAIHETDEAIREAQTVLEAEPNRIDAALVAARALAVAAASPSQTTARRERALRLLDEVVKRDPKLAAAYHQAAEIQLNDNKRDQAVATLHADLAAIPDDAIAASELIRLLAEPARPGQTVTPEKFAEAQNLANALDARDPKGKLTLAAAVGFHKAGQLEKAEEWAKKASAKLDPADPILHLNHGDILLSLAEQPGLDKPAAKDYFERAIEQYDLVLKSQPNSVEAINNKAWILHTYLGRSEQALKVARELLDRVDPVLLPGEFFDTLGAIQEATGNARDAEKSYDKGLVKAPDHPVLNLHMGKLLVADKTRADRALPYLEKAFAARDRMSPAMAAEAASLWKRLNGGSAN